MSCYYLKLLEISKLLINVQVLCIDTSLVLHK